MKKEYMNPSLEVMEIKANLLLLAGSTLSINDDEVGGEGALGHEFDDDFDFGE